MGDPYWSRTSNFWEENFPKSSKLFSCGGFTCSMVHYMKQKSYLNGAVHGRMRFFRHLTQLFKCEIAFCNSIITVSFNRLPLFFEKFTHENQYVVSVSLWNWNWVFKQWFFLWERVLILCAFESEWCNICICIRFVLRTRLKCQHERHRECICQSIMCISGRAKFHIE